MRNLLRHVDRAIVLDRAIHFDLHTKFAVPVRIANLEGASDLDEPDAEASHLHTQWHVGSDALPAISDCPSNACSEASKKFHDCLLLALVEVDAWRKTF
ncbi:MAG TPA: hypothetical protein DEB13_03415 [Candidatus Yanofskybacteria bacterium]|nr:hypothetical protein [Candidatus Yanofskybacteria bacterium]